VEGLGNAYRGGYPAAALLRHVRTVADGSGSEPSGLGWNMGGLVCVPTRSASPRARRVAFVSAVVLAASVAGAAPTGADVRQAPRRSPSIYWGAYIEGAQTYSHLYGGSWANAPWDASTWNRFEANAGKRVSIEHYGQPPPWKQPFDRVPAELVYRHGAIPAIDLSTEDVPLRQIAAGGYDRPIADWAKAAKAWGHPFFLILDVEMNGSWEPYAPGVNGNTSRDFVLAWRHMHDIFSAAGATNVTWVWCPNVDARNQLVPYDQLYPGESYVDWTGLDGYDADGTSSFSSLFASSYKKLLALAPTKPIMISQMAAEETGGSKAAWITDALSRQLPHRFPHVKAVLWFNWRIYERGRWFDWAIESTPVAQAAFAQAISSAYYRAGRRGARLPLLAKVRPLP
jgi:mannan endo-1,4-beta-mannosidase